MITMDLNSDLGESYGTYICGNDSQLMGCITSANIACGFHASDPTVMRKTVQMAVKNNVRVGAHPGFPDLQGFGRREMELSGTELRDTVLYQIGALDAFCRAEGTRLQHVKPHGAMYNMALRRKEIAQPICEAVRLYDPELILIGPAGSILLRTAQEQGLRTAGEFFSDRAYEEDGTLVRRNQPGALILDPEEAAQRVLKMITDKTVTAASGKEIPMEADTICVHGDSPEALQFARTIRDTLIKNGIGLHALT